MDRLEARQPGGARPRTRQRPDRAQRSRNQLSGRDHGGRPPQRHAHRGGHRHCRPPSREIGLLGSRAHRLRSDRRTAGPDSGRAVPEPDPAAAVRPARGGGRGSVCAPARRLPAPGHRHCGERRGGGARMPRRRHLHRDRQALPALPLAQSRDAARQRLDHGRRARRLPQGGQGGRGRLGSVQPREEDHQPPRRGRRVFAREAARRTR